jgi:hypothetical protein
MHQGALSIEPEPLDGDGVQEQEIRRRGELHHRAFHGAAGGLEDVDLVDLLGLGKSHPDREGDLVDPGEKDLPFLGGHLFGIVEAGKAGEVGLLGEDHGGGHHRASQGAASRLVQTRHHLRAPGAGLGLGHQHLLEAGGLAHRAGRPSLILGEERAGGDPGVVLEPVPQMGESRGVVEERARLVLKVLEVRFWVPQCLSWRREWGSASASRSRLSRLLSAGRNSLSRYGTAALGDPLAPRSGDHRTLKAGRFASFFLMASRVRVTVTLLLAAGSRLAEVPGKDPLREPPSVRDRRHPRLGPRPGIRARRPPGWRGLGR